MLMSFGGGGVLNNTLAIFKLHDVGNVGRARLDLVGICNADGCLAVAAAAACLAVGVDNVNLLRGRRPVIYKERAGCVGITVGVVAEVKTAFVGDYLVGYVPLAPRKWLGNEIAAAVDALVAVVDCGFV